MDQIYVNTQKIIGHYRSFKGELKSSEDTSVNHEVIQTVRLETTRPGLPGVEVVKKSSCTAGTILLALLCFFLLTGLITLGFVFIKDKSQWETERVMLQELYDNVTRERNQLQASYNNLTTERDQLQASYNILTTRQNQLQASYKILTTERNQLQASYNILTTERNQLQASYNILTTERNQLQASYNILTTRQNQLQASYNNLTTERNKLQASYNNLTTRQNQLQASYNNLTTKQNQLQASYNNLTTERNQLQASYNILTTERNQLQVSYNILTTERNQLQASYNRAVQERDQLQKSLEVMTKNRDNLQALIQNCQNSVVFSGSFYYVSSTEKSWQESRQDCLQRGADLMIINSQEEQNFANQFKKYLWFGMTDIDIEGRWKSVDGTPVTTSYWTGGEPNGGRNENCGQIKSYNLQNSWNDENCLISHFWICEKRVSP